MDTNILLILALVLIVIQSASLVLVWAKKRKLQNSHSLVQKSGKLALTKKQLYREIERHQETEVTLQETQTYLQSLIDSMPSILIGVSPKGTVTHWNKSAEVVTGLTLDAVFGKELEVVFPTLPVSMTLIEKTLSSGEAQYMKNIKQGHGSQALYTDLVVYPLVVSEEVEEAVVMATDVSQRVHMENRLMQSDKMHGLGEMAAGLAHEINNPLAGILHHIQNIKRRTSTTLPANKASAEKLGIKIEDVYQYLHERNILSFIDNIKIAGERASQIINNMLNFSRNSPLTFVATDFAELVEYAVELTTNSFSQAAQAAPGFPSIKIKINEEHPQLECAPIEIQQVIINLLRNAIQAFDSDDFSRDRQAEITLNVKLNTESLVFTVNDNGPGMSAAVRDHIFEPFFTTKRVGQGTGLGLSVCYFIVKDHHEGDIQVESEPGQGSCFTVTLPLLHTYHPGKSTDLSLHSRAAPKEYSQQI